MLAGQASRVAAAIRRTGGATYPTAPAIRGSVHRLLDTYPGIGPSTIQPDWYGRFLDLESAIGVYRQAWKADEHQRLGTAG